MDGLSSSESLSLHCGDLADQLRTQDPPIKVPEPIKFALSSVTYMVEKGKSS